MSDIQDSLKALHAYPASALPAKDVNVLHEFFHRSRVANVRVNLAIDKMELSTHDEEGYLVVDILLNVQSFTYRLHEWAKNSVAIDYLPKSIEELSVVQSKLNNAYKDVSDASRIIDDLARRTPYSIHIPPVQDHIGEIKGCILQILHLIKLALVSAEEEKIDAGF